MGRQYHHSEYSCRSIKRDSPVLQVEHCSRVLLESQFCHQCFLLHQSGQLSVPLPSGLLCPEFHVLRDLPCWHLERRHVQRLVLHMSSRQILDSIHGLQQQHVPPVRCWHLLQRHWSISLRSLHIRHLHNFHRDVSLQRNASLVQIRQPCRQPVVAGARRGHSELHEPGSDIHLWGRQFQPDLG
jgi:hypothetical protein